MSVKPYSALIHQSVISTADATRVYGGNRRLAVQMLDYLRRKEFLVQVRRGLYVPGPAVNPNWRSDWDPYLLAMRVRPGSIIAFHSAFVVHGVAHNPTEQTIHVATGTRFAPFVFEGLRYQPHVLGARPLKRSSQSLARGGEVIRATRPEWTVAMSARLLGPGGGFEEVFQSAAGFRRIDMKELLIASENQKSLGIYNRVGFLAWLNRRRWRVQPNELAPFRKHLARSPVTFGAGPDGGTYVHEWNLFIPRSSAGLLGEDYGTN